MPLDNTDTVTSPSTFGLDSKEVTKSRLNDNFDLCESNDQTREDRIENSWYDSHGHGILQGLLPDTPYYGGLSVDIAEGIALIGYSISIVAGSATITANMDPGYLYLRQDGTFHDAGGTATPPTGIASFLYATYTSDGYDSLTVTLATRGLHRDKIEVGVAGAISAGIIKTCIIDQDFWLEGIKIVVGDSGLYGSTTVDFHVGAAGAVPQTVFGTQANRPSIASLAAAYTVGISGVPDTNRSIPAGYVYVIEMDDITLCHLGDLGHPLAPHTIEEIGDVDILFLPVGEVSTIPLDTAVEIVRQLEPPVVIPMHYKTEAFTGNLSLVDKFLDKMRVRGLEAKPKLSITSSSLPGSTQTIVLSYLHS